MAEESRLQQQNRGARVSVQLAVAQSYGRPSLDARRLFMRLRGADARALR